MLTVGRLLKQMNSKSRAFIHTSTSPERHLSPFRRVPNTVDYDKLIYEAGKVGNFTRLRELLIKRINSDSLFSKHAFMFITHVNYSVSTLRTLFDTLAFLPAGRLRGSAFGCLVARLCTLGRVDHALHLLDEMRERNLERNATTYDPVIFELCRTEGFERAFEVMMEMEKDGVDPDTRLYNHLLTNCCSRRDLGNAAEVLGIMTRKGLRGDKVMYDAMVLGACRAGKVEAAVALLRAAVEDDVTLMNGTYEHVIKALLHGGFYVQGFKLVVCLSGWNKNLDVDNFDVLGRLLIHLKRYVEAKMVVDEINKRRLYMGPKLRRMCLAHGLN